MHSILIVGNVTKDIYLRLDNRKNHFETDQNHIRWLDLAFDGTSHRYFSRVSIYGGASVSLEVFSRFGLQTSISDTPATFLNGEFLTNDSNVVFRYILCQDDTVSYLAPSDIRETTWQIPTENPEWVYLDRSANISPKLSEQVLEYLNLNQEVKLAIFINRHSNQNASYIQDLVKRANLVISDVKLLEEPKYFIYIDQHYIEYQNERVFWSLESRQDLMTHLSSHQTIAASVFGALVNGKSSTDALLIARANVESARLNGTSNLNTLENMITDDYYRVEKSSAGDDDTMKLEDNAHKLMTLGRGILAADESGGSIHKKFESMQIPDDEQHRRDYRNLFFTTPDLEKYVNGVILFDETARQTADDGSTFIKFLNAKGIMAGIKVDQGLVNFDNSDEKYTKGLDDLSERLTEYYGLGARFAKWRAAFEVTDHTPSDMAIQKNAEILADYALTCQKANIVPIVEPELVYDGDYPIEKNIEFTGKILDQLFVELKEREVDLAGCVLKVNMVLAGKRYQQQSTPAEVGRATADILREHVPSELAGVVFLSGGQSVEQATANLQEVTNNGPFPWPVTFSFARALQDPALQAWKGDNTNADAARAAFKERLIANVDALIKK